MSKIRINELARQLEVKSREVIEKLQEFGIAEKVTHSSSIDDDMAERLRVYYSGNPAPASSRQRSSSGAAIAERDDEWSEEAETPAPPAPRAPRARGESIATPTPETMTTASGASAPGSEGHAVTAEAAPQPAVADQKEDDNKPRALPLR